MGSTTPVVLALDCSTSACKAVAVNLEGATVCAARRGLTVENPRPGFFEQDPDQWWQAASAALHELTEQLAGTEILALGITHQRETFACLDADGRPLRPAILWVDSRGSALAERIGTPRIHQQTGKPPSSVPSLYKLAWLAEQEPQVLRATERIVDVHAYVAARLTGSVISSVASADSLGLVDMGTQSWATDLVTELGLRTEQLPELRPAGAVLGGVLPRVAEQTGLPAGVPVIAGAGDGQCAGLGVGATSPAVAYLNLGTSVSLGSFRQGYATYPGLRTLLTPWPGRTAVEALLPAGGLALTWFKRLASVVTDPDLDRLASTVAPGAGGLVFLPYLTGRETPSYRPQERAALLGIGFEHGPPEVLRAIVEGVAFDQLASLHHLEEQVATGFADIVVTGGLTESVLVREVVAEVFGRPLTIAPEREGTALGAAMIAAAAVGVHESLDQAVTAMARPGRIVTPDPERTAAYAQVARRRASLAAD